MVFKMNLKKDRLNSALDFKIALMNLSLFRKVHNYLPWKRYKTIKYIGK